ncbi:TadE family type IV pilus minor pilin [Nocardiopsis gilva]|uniref:TadE family type IV pilus minor pilin n=1 Tax=Nocardiopsis gilva TaxID=280236 RepID=UPI000349FD12|nr:TadE family type IV pilus minor pilin [Nocardiopsis gilva]
MTAETAVALPSLVLVLGVGLAAVQAVTVQLACVDAARIGARALARGESEDAVVALVANVAPDAADAELSEDGGFARVAVSAPVRLGSEVTVPIDVVGEAATPLEPSSSTRQFGPSS